MKTIQLIISVVSLVCITSACGGSSQKKTSDATTTAAITVTGADGKVYESYREACRNGDFEAAHKFIDKYKDNSIRNHSYEDRVLAQEAEDYIFNYEINTLISQNSIEANDRIIFLFNEITISGKKGPIGVEHIRGTAYGASCAAFNEKCNKVLETAISLKNQDLAKKLLSLYKEDEIIASNGNYYIEAYTYDTKNAAQAKYDEAFGEKKEKVQNTSTESKKKRRK